jgi:hypothetical protein
MENQQPIPPGQPIDDAGVPTPPPQRRPRVKRLSLQTLGGNGLFLLAAVVVIVLVYSFIDRVFLDPPVSPETIHEGKSHTIQLDVLNGSGASRLGQKFTDYLRARGFDVVEMGNYKESTVEYSQVVDKAGDLAAALQVAEALGISKNRVTQKIDKNAYLDVTVIIGRDFRSLKPLN